MSLPASPTFHLTEKDRQYLDMLPTLVDQLLNFQGKLSEADTPRHLSDGQSGPNRSNHQNQVVEILEKIFQYQSAVCHCPSRGSLTSPSLTINITGPLNIKITRDEKVSAGRDKFTAMHDGMDETDADDESTGGDSDRIFRQELQKELNNLKFKGQNLKDEF